MPTLVRFFIVLLVLAGLTGAGMIYLANFVHPNTREMTVRIPANRLEPTAIPRPPAAAPAPADGTAPTDGATPDATGTPGPETPVTPQADAAAPPASPPATAPE